jgi:hypothetical protein
MSIARVERFNLESTIVLGRLHNFNFGHGDIKHGSPPYESSALSGRGSEMSA